MSSVKPFDYWNGPHNLDFEPADVIGKYPNPIVKGALVFAGVTAVTAGVLAGFGALPDLGDAGTLNRERQELAEEQEAHTRALDRKENNAIEADGNLDQIQIDLGEGCVALIQNYMAGGPLANTPEDSIVSDIVDYENQSCGDTPTEIRTSVRSLFAAQAAVSHARSELEEEQDVVIDDDLSGYESDAENRLWLRGLALGAGLGILFGIPAGKASFNYYRDKSNVAEHKLSNYLKPRIAKQMRKETWDLTVKIKSDDLAEEIVRLRMPELAEK